MISLKLKKLISSILVLSMLVSLVQITVSATDTNPDSTNRGKLGILYMGTGDDPDFEHAVDATQFDPNTTANWAAGTKFWVGLAFWDAKSMDEATKANNKAKKQHEAGISHFSDMDTVQTRQRETLGGDGGLIDMQGGFEYASKYLEPYYFSSAKKEEYRRWALEEDEVTAITDPEAQEAKIQELIQKWFEEDTNGKVSANFQTDTLALIKEANNCEYLIATNYYTGANPSTNNNREPNQLNDEVDPARMFMLSGSNSNVYSHKIFGLLNEITDAQKIYVAFGCFRLKEKPAGGTRVLIPVLDPENLGMEFGEDTSKEPRFSATWMEDRTKDADDNLKAHFDYVGEIDFFPSVGDDFTLTTETDAVVKQVGGDTEKGTDGVYTGLLKAQKYTVKAGARDNKRFVAWTLGAGSSMTLLDKDGNAITGETEIAAELKKDEITFQASTDVKLEASYDDIQPAKVVVSSGSQGAVTDTSFTNAYARSSYATSDGFRQKYKRTDVEKNYSFKVVLGGDSITTNEKKVTIQQISSEGNAVEDEDAQYKDETAIPLQTTTGDTYTAGYTTVDGTNGTIISINDKFMTNLNVDKYYRIKVYCDRATPYIDIVVDDTDDNYIQADIRDSISSLNYSYTHGDKLDFTGMKFKLHEGQPSDKVAGLVKATEYEYDSTNKNWKVTDPSGTSTTKTFEEVKQDVTFSIVKVSDDTIIPGYNDVDDTTVMRHNLLDPDDKHETAKLKILPKVKTGRDGGEDTSGNVQLFGSAQTRVIAAFSNKYAVSKKELDLTAKLNENAKIEQEYAGTPSSGTAQVFTNDLDDNPNEKKIGFTYEESELAYSVTSPAARDKIEISSNGAFAFESFHADTYTKEQVEIDKTKITIGGTDGSNYTVKSVTNTDVAGEIKAKPIAVEMSGVTQLQANTETYIDAATSEPVKYTNAQYNTNGIFANDSEKVALDASGAYYQFKKKNASGGFENLTEGDGLSEGKIANGQKWAVASGLALKLVDGTTDQKYLTDYTITETAQSSTVASKHIKSIEVDNPVSEEIMHGETYPQATDLKTIANTKVTVYWGGSDDGKYTTYKAENGTWVPAGEQSGKTGTYDATEYSTAVGAGLKIDYSVSSAIPAHNQAVYDASDPASNSKEIFASSDTASVKVADIEVVQREVDVRFTNTGADTALSRLYNGNDRFINSRNVVIAAVVDPGDNTDDFGIATIDGQKDSVEVSSFGLVYESKTTGIPAKDYDSAGKMLKAETINLSNPAYKVHESNKLDNAMINKYPINLSFVSGMPEGTVSTDPTVNQNTATASTDRNSGGTIIRATADSTANGADLPSDVIEAEFDYKINDVDTEGAGKKVDILGVRLINDSDRNFILKNEDDLKNLTDENKPTATVKPGTTASDAKAEDPLLEYTHGDQLDLTNLKIKINDGNKDIEYQYGNEADSDWKQNGLKVEIAGNEVESGTILRYDTYRTAAVENTDENYETVQLTVVVPAKIGHIPQAAFTTSSFDLLDAQNLNYDLKIKKKLLKPTADKTESVDKTYDGKSDVLTNDLSKITLTADNAQLVDNSERTGGKDEVTFDKEAYYSTITKDGDNVTEISEQRDARQEAYDISFKSITPGGSDGINYYVDAATAKQINIEDGGIIKPYNIEIKADEDLELEPAHIDKNAPAEGVQKSGTKVYSGANAFVDGEDVTLTFTGTYTQDQVKNGDVKSDPLVKLDALPTVSKVEGTNNKTTNYTVAFKVDEQTQKTYDEAQGEVLTVESMKITHLPQMVYEYNSTINYTNMEIAVTIGTGEHEATDKYIYGKFNGTDTGWYIDTNAAGSDRYKYTNGNVPFELSLSNNGDPSKLVQGDTGAAIVVTSTDAKKATATLDSSVTDENKLTVTGKILTLKVVYPSDMSKTYDADKEYNKLDKITGISFYQVVKDEESAQADATKDVSKTMDAATKLVTLEDGDKNIPVNVAAISAVMNSKDANDNNVIPAETGRNVTSAISEELAKDYTVMLVNDKADVTVNPLKITVTSIAPPETNIGGSEGVLPGLAATTVSDGVTLASITEEVPKGDVIYLTFNYKYDSTASADAKKVTISDIALESSTKDNDKHNGTFYSTNYEIFSSEAAAGDKETGTVNSGTITGGEIITPSTSPLPADEDAASAIQLQRTYYHGDPLDTAHLTVKADYRAGDETKTTAYKFGELGWSNQVESVKLYGKAETPIVVEAGESIPVLRWDDAKTEGSDHYYELEVTLKDSMTQLGNISLQSVNTEKVKLTVLPKPLEVTAAATSASIDRKYDGTKDVYEKNGEKQYSLSIDENELIKKADGTVDVVAPITAAVQYKTSDAIETGNAIDVTDITFTGADEGCYTPANKTATIPGKIEPKEIEFVIPAKAVHQSATAPSVYDITDEEQTYEDSEVVVGGAAEKIRYKYSAQYTDANQLRHGVAAGETAKITLKEDSFAQIDNLTNYKLIPTGIEGRILDYAVKEYKVITTPKRQYEYGDTLSSDYTGMHVQAVLEDDDRADIDYKYGILDENGDQIANPPADAAATWYHKDEFEQNAKYKPIDHLPFIVGIEGNEAEDLVFHKLGLHHLTVTENQQGAAVGTTVAKGVSTGTEGETVVPKVITIDVQYGPGELSNVYNGTEKFGTLASKDAVMTYDGEDLDFESDGKTVIIPTGVGEETVSVNMEKIGIYTQTKNAGDTSIRDTVVEKEAWTDDKYEIKVNADKPNVKITPLKVEITSISVPEARVSTIADEGLTAAATTAKNVPEGQYAAELKPVDSNADMPNEDVTFEFGYEYSRKDESGTTPAVKVSNVKFTGDSAGNYEVPDIDGGYEADTKGSVTENEINDTNTTEDDEEIKVKITKDEADYVHGATMSLSDLKADVESSTIGKASYSYDSAPASDWEKQGITVKFSDGTRVPDSYVLRRNDPRANNGVLPLTVTIPNVVKKVPFGLTAATEVTPEFSTLDNSYIGTVNININRRVIEGALTGADAIDREYNGETAIDAALISGVGYNITNKAEKNGGFDDVWIELSDASYDSADASDTAKDVTFAKAEKKGDDADCYELPESIGKGKGTVSPKNVTVTVDTVPSIFKGAEVLEAEATEVSGNTFAGTDGSDYKFYAVYDSSETAGEADVTYIVKYKDGVGSNPNTDNTNYKVTLTGPDKGKVEISSVVKIELTGGTDTLDTDVTHGDPFALDNLEVTVSYKAGDVEKYTFKPADEMTGTKAGWYLDGEEVPADSLPFKTNWSDENNTPTGERFTRPMNGEKVVFTPTVIDPEVPVEDITAETDEFKIDQKKVTLTLIKPVSKIYDGTAAAAFGPDHFLVDGAVEGETVTVVTAVGIYTDGEEHTDTDYAGEKNVVKASDADVTSVTLSSDNYTYELSEITKADDFKASIEVKPVRITSITAPSKNRGDVAEFTAVERGTGTFTTSPVDAIVEADRAHFTISYSGTYTSTSTVSDSVQVNITDNKVEISGNEDDKTNYTITFDGNATGAVNSATVTPSRGGGGGGGVTNSMYVDIVDPENGSKTRVSIKTGIRGVEGTNTIVSTTFRAYLKDKSVTWTSSDESIVKVDEDGNVTFVAPGEAVITAVSNGDKNLSQTFSVIVDPADIEGTPAPEASQAPVVRFEFAAPYVRGYEDGSFGPEKPITREEVSTMFARIRANSLTLDQAYESSFTDVSAENWSKDFIGYLAQFGIVNGYEDGTFKPKNNITRAEMAVMVSRAMEIDVSVDDLTTPFSDIETRFDNWATAAIKVLSEQGIITGYEDGTFKPAQSITRAETVTMINRMIKAGEVEEIKVRPTDVTDAHWAYDDIIKSMNDRITSSAADSSEESQAAQSGAATISGTTDNENETESPETTLSPEATAAPEGETEAAPEATVDPDATPAPENSEEEETAAEPTATPNAGPVVLRSGSKK